MKRPVIIVDLDNVVYDWVGAMAQWLNTNSVLNFANEIIEVKSYGPITKAQIAISKYSQWAVWDDWNIPQGEFIRWWRLGVEAGEIYARGPLIPGARDALWRLSDAEWDIHIATSRLTKFGLHDRIVENTSSWLRDNNIPYRQLSFTNQKTRIIADAIVDDRADNMDPYFHERTFLYAAPHNVAEPQERCTWPDIVEALLG
jgi:5'(3')-deoxyribonucleotidase